MCRFLTVALLFGLVAVTAHAADAPPDTKKAAATREKLKTKLVTYECKMLLLSNVIEDLKELTDVAFHIDTKSGVSRNSKITYKCEKKPLQDVLEEICKNEDIGYVVIVGDIQYDGYVSFRKSKERGYPEGVTPPKETVVKPEPKPEPKPDPKPEPKPEPKPTDDPNEQIAARKLRTAQKLIADGLLKEGKESLQEVIDKYPKSKAAEDAKKELEKLKK